MTTKKELEELVIRVDERTKRIPLIEQHLKENNGHCEEAILAVSVTREIAEANRDNIKEVRRDISRRTIGIIIALITAIGGIVAAIVL